MQQKFLSNLLLMVLLNLLVKPLAIFGVDAAVQNRVGAEEYGVYFALLNFSFLFNILLDLGINNFTTKNVAQHPHLANKYLGKVLGFRFFLLLLYIIVSFGIALFLDWNSYELFLLSLLVLNQFFITLIAYVRGHLGGFLLFKTEAIIGVLDRFLLILFCAYALYFSTNQEITIEWFVWMQTLCYGLTFFISFFILFKKIGLPKIKFNSAFSIVIIRRSLPYALLILLMMIYTRIDSVMIEQIHSNGKKEAGFYAQGFRLINALFLFAMLFSNLLYPMFSKMIKEKLNIIPLLAFASKLLIVGSMGLAIVSFFNAEYILSLIYNHNIVDSAPSFQLLMIAFIGMCSTIVYGTLLTAKGNLKFLNMVSFIGLLVNIIINLILIPKHGAYGAAIATVITQSIVSLIQYLFVVKHLSISWKSFQWIKIPAFLIILTVISFYFSKDSVLLLVALFSSIPLLMILFNVLSFDNFKTIMKQTN